VLRRGLLCEYCLADAFFLLLLSVLQSDDSVLYFSCNKELDFLNKREWFYKAALQLTLHIFHYGPVLPHQLHKAWVANQFFLLPFW